jgi:hypothetical protein
MTVYNIEATKIVLEPISPTDDNPAPNGFQKCALRLHVDDTTGELVRVEEFNVGYVEL